MLETISKIPAAVVMGALWSVSLQLSSFELSSHEGEDPDSIQITERLRDRSERENPDFDSLGFRLEANLDGVLVDFEARSISVSIGGRKMMLSDSSSKDGKEILVKSRLQDFWQLLHREESLTTARIKSLARQVFWEEDDSGTGSNSFLNMFHLLE